MRYGLTGKGHVYVSGSDAPHIGRHHKTIRAGLNEVRRHCSEANPSSRELAQAREQLTAASLARSRIVSVDVVATLLMNADDGLRTALSGLLFATATNRMFSRAHIEQWTSTPIETDWSDYCDAARDIWPMMEDQIERERLVLGTTQAATKASSRS